MASPGLSNVVAAGSRLKALERLLNTLGFNTTIYTSAEAHLGDATTATASTT